MANQNSTDCCPVCLKELGSSRIGKLPCSHIFCLLCIEEWSKNMNTCPIDRKKFDHIKVYLHVMGKCIGEVAVTDKNIKELFIEDENTECELCHSTTNEDLLLLCDGCDRGFHTYCLTPPLSDVPDGLWYCTRCLPIVTSVSSDNDIDYYHGIGYHSDSSDEEIVISFNPSAQRSSRRISSDSSTEGDDDYVIGDDVDDAMSSPPSSQVSSHDDASSYAMTTDSDDSAASQHYCSNYAVTNSNQDSDSSAPHGETVTSAGTIRVAYSNHIGLHHDCLSTDSNHGDNTTQLISEHGNNIKRRLRNHCSVKNGHQVRSSTGSLVRCILSVSDSEQSDADYIPPYGSCPSSSRRHNHTEIHQVKYIKRKPHTPPPPSVTKSKSRGIKRRHRKNKGGKKKQRKLQKSLQKYSLRKQHLMATPSTPPKRARTAATSPRVVNTTIDTPQSAIRRLAIARYQTESLEEARRVSQVRSKSQLTQNDIIAHHVRSKQQQQQSLWWDHKDIECHKSNMVPRVVCSPLKNAIKRHPLISPASLKYLDKQHGRQKEKQAATAKVSNDFVGDIFAGMDTLYNKDTVVSRSGEIITPPTHKK